MDAWQLETSGWGSVLQAPLAALIEKVPPDISGGAPTGQRKPRFSSIRTMAERMTFPRRALMSTPPRIGFIGAGQMATALARGWIAAGLISPDRLAASDPVPAARQRFQADTGAAAGAGEPLLPLV